MDQIVNLRRVRKDRAKAEAADQAAANRVRHGRTLAERDSERRLAEQAARRLDQLKRDDP